MEKVLLPAASFRIISSVVGERRSGETEPDSPGMLLDTRMRSSDCQTPSPWQRLIVLKIFSSKWTFLEIWDV